MQNIGVTLRKRYVLALSIIALLVLGSQVVIQYTIHSESGDSRVINIAGRQRMLSQRINKCIFGALDATTPTEKKRYIDELETSVQLWEISHNGLQYGDKELGLPGRNSKKIMSLFLKADPFYRKILSASKEIITSGDNNDVYLLPLLQIVKDNEQNFLKLMDVIVFQYDAEAKNKIFVIRTIEIFLMLFTFIVLTLEARFIFLPAERSIQKTFTEITESNESILKVFEIAPAALFLLVPPNLQVTQMNSLAEEFLRSMCINVDKKNLLKYFQENLESEHDLANKMINGNSFSDEEAVLKSTDSIKAVLVSCSTINFNGTPSIIVSMMDISRQKHAEEILKRYATTDELTGLLNRRSGRIIMDNSVERSARENLDLAVCFCDIDGLKYVNDSFGHDEGDWYIVAIADAIKSNLRADDFAFRYGGDELVIILNNCNQERAEIILQRINNSIDRKLEQFQKPYNMSISVGVAVLYPKENTTVDDLIAKADMLMYKEKRRKRSL